MLTTKEITCLSIHVTGELESLKKLCDSCISFNVTDIENQLNRKEFLLQLQKKLDVMYEDAYRESLKNSEVIK